MVSQEMHEEQKSSFTVFITSNFNPKPPWNNASYTLPIVCFTWLPDFTFHLTLLFTLPYFSPALTFHLTLLFTWPYFSPDLTFHLTLFFTWPYFSSDLTFHLTLLFTLPYFSPHLIFHLTWPSTWLYLSPDITEHPLRTSLRNGGGSYHNGDIHGHVGKGQS